MAGCCWVGGGGLSAGGGRRYGLFRRRDFAAGSRVVLDLILETGVKGIAPTPTSVDAQSLEMVFYIVRGHASKLARVMWERACFSVRWGLGLARRGQSQGVGDYCGGEMQAECGMGRRVEVMLKVSE